MQIWLKNISLLSNIKMLFAVFRASIMVASIVEKNEVNKVHVNNACIVVQQNVLFLEDKIFKHFPLIILSLSLSPFKDARFEKKK